MRQLTLDKLAELHLKGMTGALKEQMEDSSLRDVDFEDRLLMLLDAEDVFRKERRMRWRIKTAGLRQNARPEELDLKTGRRLDRALFEKLCRSDWLKEKRNAILTGPTGIGKTFLASALAHAACQNNFNVRYFRVPRLLMDLAIARAQGTTRTKLASISRIDLLVLDDWLLAPLADAERRDLLENRRRSL